MPAKSPGVPYVPALTGIRAVAAGLVFAHHMAQVAWMPSMFREGYIGVTMFFALSGYLITRTYADRFVAGKIRFLEYWLRRAARILPVYLAVLAAKLAWTWDKIDHPAQVLAPLTLTQAFFGQFRFAGLNPGWSLTIEESFYLIAPPIWLLLARRRSLAFATLALAGICWALWGVGMLFPLLDLPWYTLYRRDQMEVYSIFGRMPEFAVGMLAALWLARAKPAKPKKRLSWPSWKDRAPDGMFVAGVAATLGSLAWLYSMSIDRKFEWGISHPDGWYAMFLSAIGTCAIIASAVRGSGLCAALLGNRALEYLGRISFALYLLQDRFIVDAFEAGLLRWTPLRGHSPWATYVAMSLAAAALYEGLEKPVHRWLIVRIGNRRRRSGSKTIKLVNHQVAESIK